MATDKNFVIKNGLTVGTTEVIDSSSNLTNIGTISSGVITIGSSTVATPNAAADDFVIKGSGTAVGMTIAQDSDSGTGTIFFGDTTNSAVGGFRYNHNTGDMAISAEDFVNFNADGLQISGTTVIDSSRNLTNIGTISSGFIDSRRSGGNIPTSANSNLYLVDTRTLAADTGGSIVFSSYYQGTSAVSGGSYIKGYKENATSGDYGYGLKFGVRENGQGSTGAVFTLNSSGNATFTGTISSGAITADSTGTNTVTIDGTGSFTLRSYHDSGGVGWATGSGASFNNLLYLDDSNDFVRIYSGQAERARFNSSGIDARSGGFRINGTTVIDSSRNLTNIGTISSGAITANANTTINQFYCTQGSLDDWQSSPISIRERSLNTSASTSSTYAPNLNFHWSGVVSRSLTMLSDGSFVLGEWGAGTPNTTSSLSTLNTGAYQINGTTVIDSSRNLTNIGTISSGDITTSGNMYINTANDGLYFSGGNNRIYFNNNRALEGATDGSSLQVGEGYTNILAQGNLTASGYLRTSSNGIYGKMSDEWQTDNALRGGNFSADIGNDTTVLKLFPASPNDESSNARAAGDYSTGIAFMHLDPDNSGWGTGYTGAQAWVGLKVESTPGQEFSSFVIATNGSSTAGTMPTERFKISSTGVATFTGSVNLTGGGLALGNYSISGVNDLTFNDPGPNEGLSWSSGNIKIYESPDDLTTNTAGNLQVVYGSTRRLTVNSTGIDVNGNITAPGGTVDVEVLKADDSGTTPSACKLHVGAINSAGSSAIAQFGGFIRTATHTIVHSAAGAADSVFMSYTEGDIDFRTGEGSGANCAARVNSLKIGLSTVIDSSRNLTNIGTISTSGQIDAGGSVKVTNWIELESSGASLSSEEAGLRWDYNDSALWYLYKDNANDGALHIQSAATSGEADATPRVRFHRTARETYFGGAIGVNKYSVGSGLNLDVAGAIGISGTTVISSGRAVTAVSYGAPSGTTALYYGYNGREMVTGVDGAAYYHGSDGSGYGIVIQGGHPICKSVKIGSVNAGTTVIDSSRNIRNVPSAEFTGGSYAASVDSVTDAGVVLTQTKKIYSLANSNQYLRNIFEHNSSGNYIFGQLGTSLIADMYFQCGTSGNIVFNTGGATNTGAKVDSSGNFIAQGNVTAYGSVSDIRRKENVEIIPDALDKLKTLDGITFNFKDRPKKRMTGVIAQQVEKILPEAVYETTTMENEETKAVHYGNMVGLLIEAIKEQQQQIEELKEEVSSLSSKI